MLYVINDCKALNTQKLVKELPSYMTVATSARFSSEHVEEMRYAFNICWLDRKLPEAEVQGFQAVVTSLAQDFQKLAALLLRALASSLGTYMLQLSTSSSASCSSINFLSTFHETDKFPFHHYCHHGINSRKLFFLICC